MKKIYILLTTLLFFTLLLAGSELILRSFNYHKLRVKPGSFGHSGYILRESDANVFNRSVDWFYRITTDLRPREYLEVEGEKYFYKKGHLKKRVLAIGDSGTFGTGLRRTEAWPAQLQSELLEHNDNWEVMNFGLPGALLQDIHQFYANFLVDYRADYVILALFMANDINQSIYLNPQALNNKIENHNEFWWQRTALYSFLQLQRAKLKRLAIYSLPESENDYTHDGLRLGHFIEGEFALYQAQQDPKVLMAFEKVMMTLKSLRDIIEGHGGKLVLTFVPTRSYLENKLDIRPIFKQDEETIERYSHERLNFARPLDQVLDIARVLDIEAVSSASMMRSSHGSSVLLHNDDHLNLLGSSLMAIDLANFLTNHPKE